MEHCLCVRPLGPKRHRNEILSESRGRGRLFDLVQDLAERTRVRHIRGLWSVGTHSLSLMHATTNTCHPDWGAQISDRINWDSNTIPVFCEHRNINKRTTPGTRRQGCTRRAGAAERKMARVWQSSTTVSRVNLADCVFIPSPSAVWMRRAAIHELQRAGLGACPLEFSTVGLCR